MLLKRSKYCNIQKNWQYFEIDSPTFLQRIGGLNLETASSRRQVNAEQVDLKGDAELKILEALLLLFC